jgi:hypothetical protein
MSYTIKRTDGNVAYVAKHAMLACEAVEDAVRDKADLSGADLSGADLSGAHLSGAHLSGADLTGATGIIRIGPIDGWEMYAVQRSGGPRIKAGCRWFTVDEAREWWRKGGGLGNAPEHGPLMLAGDGRRRRRCGQQKSR